MLRAIARSLSLPGSSADSDSPSKSKVNGRYAHDRRKSSRRPTINATTSNTAITSTINVDLATEHAVSAHNTILPSNTHLTPANLNHQVDADNTQFNSLVDLPFKFQPDLLISCTAEKPRYQTTGISQPSSPSNLAIVPLPALRVNNNEIDTAMLRKVWVKRPGASATRVEVNEDDLVDNVRDVILRKYANSLGRSIDSPDITIKIVMREQANKNVQNPRELSPEESISKTLDTYYPGGQTIEEALLIEVPQRRTPRASPRAGNHQLHYYAPDDYRPGDGAREYFPPMPLHSPHLTHVQHPAIPQTTLPIHSMSVLTTGQIPPLPSPGGHSTRRHTRPKYGRQHTSSPTILHSTQVSHPNSIDTKSQMNGTNNPAPSIPTPPAQPDHKNTITPPNRTTSPHPNRVKKKKQLNAAASINGDLPPPSKPASAGLLDGRVPPINVLIVEDNVINLRLLEQFMRRLKVRWKTAMNGREAVDKWRTGGFHLVLMDIQLPIMSGLEATKEIRRLEVVNGIGLSVFGDQNPNDQRNGTGQLKDEDKLDDRNLFKSPVIIVALTASSLQSDRHEALAVGCNDFLTKPVNFGWMERKVTEWGCMQALIDFDGWRKWKAIEAKKNDMDPEKRKQEEKEEKAKQRAALKAAMLKGPPSTGAEKKDKEESKTSSKDGSLTSPATEQNQPQSGNFGRRSHKGSRSSGSIGTTLPSTMEVDEKGA